jgi:hypothetical protein
MTLNLIVALIWLVLAIGSFLYVFILHTGERASVLGTDIPLIWMPLVALFMFGYRMFCWWLIRKRKRAREALRGYVASRRRTEDYHPEFDFSEEPKERDNHED